MKRKINSFMYRVKNTALGLRYPKLKFAFNIESHLTWRERITLYNLAVGKKRLAEIGSYLGASACCLAAAATGAELPIIVCIDTWNNDAMSEGARDTWKEFNCNTKHYSSLIVPVRGFSVDVVEEVRKISSVFDLLFIDGDHSYQGVKADWEVYKGFLKSGSIIIFHDYGWADGVKRVVHEDVLPLVSAHDQLPNMWWGTLAKQP